MKMNFTKKSGNKAKNFCTLFTWQVSKKIYMRGENIPKLKDMKYDELLDLCAAYIEYREKGMNIEEEFNSFCKTQNIGKIAMAFLGIEYQKTFEYMKLFEELAEEYTLLEARLQ